MSEQLTHHIPQRPLQRTRAGHACAIQHTQAVAQYHISTTGDGRGYRRHPKDALVPIDGV